jgi:hypothetical protein
MNTMRTPTYDIGNPSYVGMTNMYWHYCPNLFVVDNSQFKMFLLTDTFYIVGIL